MDSLKNILARPQIKERPGDLFEIVWSQDGGTRSAYMDVLVARFQKDLPDAL